MLLLLRLPECIRMRLESLSRRLNIIFFSLLPLINDGIQSSHKFSWSPCHIDNFATFGHLLFTKQYLAISQAVLDSVHVNFIPNCQKSSPNTYGFCLQRGMGYGLLRLYGLWSSFPCEPTWWTQKRMEFKGVWGMWAMGYEGVDCRINFSHLSSAPSTFITPSLTIHAVDIAMPVTSKILSNLPPQNWT